MCLKLFNKSYLKDTINPIQCILKLKNALKNNILKVKKKKAPNKLLHYSFKFLY